MSELSAKIARLKRGRPTAEIIEQAKVSRETFRKIERGDSVKLTTLRDICHRAFGLNDKSAEWLDIIVAWIKNEVGDSAKQLWIEAREHSSLHDAEADQSAKAMLLFTELNSEDRHEILKTMTRAEVRACLPAINLVWEKFDKPGKAAKK